MDLFGFVRRFCFGVRRKRDSLFPTTVGLHRRKVRRVEANSRQPEQSGPEKTIGILLEDHDDLLLKVLSYVMDDGLHECRLVCHRWRDLCGKLPVALGSWCTLFAYKAAELFPEAASLALNIRLDGEDVSGRPAIQHLLQLNKMKNLSLFVTSANANMNNIMAVFSTDCLRSLEITASQRDKFDSIVDALRLLTNLESLKLGLLRFIRTDREPVTELRGLRCLRTDFPVIANSRGQLLFPSMTTLTQLTLRSVPQHVPQTPSSLEVCKFIYASRISRFLLF